MSGVTSLLLALGLACSSGDGRRSTTIPGNQPTVTDDAAPPAPVVGETTSQTEWATLEEAACHGRQPCKVTEEHDAGIDGDDRLRVIVISLGRAADLDCDQFEYWLGASNDQGLLRHQLLVEQCNDGYGAAGVGEDFATVTPSWIAIGRHGGSSWRWTVETMLQASPLQVLSEGRHDEWTLGDNSWRQTWDWWNFTGIGWGELPICDPATGEAGESVSVSFVPIPVVQTPAAYASDGWRTIDLESCAVRVDGSGVDARIGELGVETRGFVIYGAEGSADDAEMKLLVSGDDLFVEVHDDNWIGPGKNWVNDDHLELWLGEEISYMEQCTDAKAGAPRQWGIRVTDGKVFSAHGNPAPIGAELVAPTGDAPARLKIRLPPDHSAITVVYSDSDDGKRQERLFATSKLAFGDAHTLGRTVIIPADRAICEIQKSKLARRITRTFSSDEAVVSGY